METIMIPNCVFHQEVTNIDSQTREQIMSIIPISSQGKSDISFKLLIWFCAIAYVNLLGVAEEYLRNSQLLRLKAIILMTKY